MKILSTFLILCALVFTNCQKTDSTDDNSEVKIINAVPFENNKFKIERASEKLPEATTKIHFFDESNGICITGGSTYGIFYKQGDVHTAGGSIYTTNDGGATWTPTYTFSKASLGCLRPIGFDVLNNNTIVAFASSSVCNSTDPSVRTNTVIRSTDKGKTWTPSGLTYTRVSDMTLGDDNTLYAVGNDGGGHEATSVFDSKDGGLTWNKTALGVSFGTVTKVMTLSPKKLMIRGSYFDPENPQLFSTNKGSSWEKKTGKEYMLGASHGDQMGLSLSTQKDDFTFKVSETHNGGDSWTTMRTFFSTTNEVKVLSNTTALIMGRSHGEESAAFTYTTDGGKSWIDMRLLDNINAGQLLTSSFYNDKAGYIVGSEGVLYKISFK